MMTLPAVLTGASGRKGHRHTDLGRLRSKGAHVGAGWVGAGWVGAGWVGAGGGSGGGSGGGTMFGVPIAALRLFRRQVCSV